MAKGVTKAPQAPRMPRPKTAAQLAKAERNKAAYEKRTKILAERERAKNEARKANVEEYRTNLFRAQFEEQFVKDALAGPHGNILRNWLKNRPALFVLVERFFNDRPKFARPNVQPLPIAA